LAGIGFIIFEGGSSTIGFLVDLHGGVASFSALERAASGAGCFWLIWRGVAATSVSNRITGQDSNEKVGSQHHTQQYHPPPPQEKKP